MAFSPPYKFKLISRVADALDTGVLLRVQITDGSGLVIRKDVTLSIGNGLEWPDIIAAIHQQAHQAFVADAGTLAAALDTAIAAGTIFDLGTGAELSGVRKSADQSTTSATFVDCTGLEFQLAPNTHYKFRFSGAYSTAAAATGMHLSVNGPASPIFLAGICRMFTAPTAVFCGALAAYDVAIAATTGPGAVPVPFEIEGTISTNAAGGSFRLRFRSETAGQSVTIRRGSIGELIAVG